MVGKTYNSLNQSIYPKRILRVEPDDLFQQHKAKGMLGHKNVGVGDIVYWN